MKERRVVVTGLGAVTPVGNDVETMWKNIVAGHSGIDYITRVDREQFPVHVAAEVKDFDPQQYIDRKDIRRMDLFTQYAVVASKMAVTDANLTINEDNATRVGVWSGYGIGGLDVYETENKQSLANS